MAKYGIHNCLHNVEDFPIQKVAGDWILFVPNDENPEADDRWIYIKACPFCKEDLEEENEYRRN